MPQEGSANKQGAYISHISRDAMAAESLVPVLIEFHDPPVVVYRSQHPLAMAQQLERYEQSLRESHQALLAKLDSQGIPHRLSSASALQACGDVCNELLVDHDFTYLFNGLGLLLPGKYVMDLAAIEGIKTLTGNHERPYLSLDHSVPFIGAPQVWELRDPSGHPVDGEGVTIAVIDTGIDFTHPAFGGYADVPNPKVIYAVSYTGEPQIDNFGHGSHCAGIAAGDKYAGTARGDSKIRGVAPKAQLMSYKVLTAMGSGTAAAIVMAIEDAVKRGAHVLNLSLGDTSGDPMSPEAIAVNNAMLAGTVVCCSAGNSGPGPATVGTPGSADLVVTVGASTDDAVTATYAHVSGGKRWQLETRPLHNSAPLTSPPPTLLYVHCGLGLDAGQFPAVVAGNIALIQRGAIPFRQKAQNAQDAGATAVVIYNNHPGNFWGTLGDNTPADPTPTIPVVSIAQADGEHLLAGGFAPDGTSRLRLQLDPLAVPIPDRLAEFSSRGPSQHLAIKPELCAPGVGIFSATIQAGPPGLSNMADPSGYTTAGGTSMAAPHIAGASALLRQLHPDWSPFLIKAALVNTSHWMDKQGRVQEQGNGRVSLLPAATAHALLMTEGATPQPTLSFGRVNHNGAVLSIAASLRLVDVSGRGGTYRLGARLEHRARGLSVAVSHRQATLAPECHAALQLTVTLDGHILAPGAYSGFVSATARNGDHLRLPFYLTTAGASNAVATSPGPHSGPLCSQ